MQRLPLLEQQHCGHGGEASRNANELGYPAADPPAPMASMPGGGYLTDATARTNYCVDDYVLRNYNRPSTTLEAWRTKSIPRSRNTSTTLGSNWPPRSRRISSVASSLDRAARYGRSVVIASNASASVVMR